jgi:hypothetical protein
MGLAPDIRHFAGRRHDWEDGMDVKTYYQKIRDTEATIPTSYTVVKSLPTDDGGKAGVLIEVPRHLAAKMVVEGSARLIAPGDVTAFQQAQEFVYKAAQEAAAASRLEVTMVSSDELKKLTDDMKKLKGGPKASRD